MRVGRVRLGGRSVIEFHDDHHQVVSVGEIAAPSRRNRFGCNVGFFRMLMIAPPVRRLPREIDKNLPMSLFSRRQASAPARPAFAGAAPAYAKPRFGGRSRSRRQAVGRDADPTELRMWFSIQKVGFVLLQISSLTEP